MDAFAAVMDALRKYAPVDKPLEYALGIIVVIVVLRLELGRNAGNRPAHHNDAPFCARFGKLFKQYAPELLSLLSCAVVAVVLRVRGSFDVQSLMSDDGSVDENAMQAAADIARQWPILLGADTLLALQAMLRVLVLVSSAVRKGHGPTLITQEAAAISLGAALGRTTLAAYSKVYLLDGPLGGNLPVICEVISAALLVFLCRGISRRALMTSAMTLAATAWVASRNQLNLAEDPCADGLFIFAHLSELLAAFAYLSYALVLDFDLQSVTRGSVALGFAHIIMPIQACLAAYYFVQAFDFVPQMIGAGKPFQILQWGCIAQVGAFAGAALLHCAEYLESSQQQAARHRDERPNAQPTIPAELAGATDSANVVPRHIAVPAAL